LVDTGCSQVHPNFQLENSSQQFYHSNLVWLLLWKTKQLAKALAKMVLLLIFVSEFFMLPYPFLLFSLLAKHGLTFDMVLY
jgi:hypothetical protein